MPINSLPSLTYFKSSLQALTFASAPIQFPHALIIPLAKRNIFPHLQASITIRDPSVQKAILALLHHNQPFFAAFTAIDPNHDGDVVEGIAEIHRIGVLCRILKYEMEEDSMTVLVQSNRRVRLQSVHSPSAASEAPVNSEETCSPPVPDSDVIRVASIESPESIENPPPSLTLIPPPSAPMGVFDILEGMKVSGGLLENCEDQPYMKGNPLLRAITSELLSTIKDLVKFSQQSKSQVTMFAYYTGPNLLDDPALLADFAASLAHNAPMGDLQWILESLVIEERVELVLLSMKRELRNAKIQHRIMGEVEERMATSRREFHLTEQMKEIKRELENGDGDKGDGRTKLLASYQARMEAVDMPSEVASVFQEVCSTLLISVGG